MKNRDTKIIGLLLIMYFILTTTLLMPDTRAAVEEFEPEFGYAPDINGDIDRSEQEWKNASKEEINLISGSPTDGGILIDIWVMQNESDLYILVRFNLLEHKHNEFIGVLISTSDSEANDSFYDAKIIQFTGGNADYFDYHIVNGNFFEDQDENGDGAAEIDEDEVIYEFRIPVNESEGEEDDDVALDFGESYAFKIIYGENTNYNQILNFKSSIVSIEIEYPPEKEEDIWKIVATVLIIITFSVIGTLFSIFIYKILNIEKNLRRVRG